MKRLLGIDYGEKRIGLALTDPLMMFAYPHDTIPNDQKIVENLRKVIDEFGVTEIVLGYPLKESGERTRISQRIDEFTNMLKNKFRLPVHLADERYSSSIAQERIISAVSSKKKRRDKGLIDKNAAAVILEDYLKSLD